MLVTPMTHSPYSFLAGRSRQFFSLETFFRVEFQPFGQLHARAAETGKQFSYRAAGTGGATKFFTFFRPGELFELIPAILALEFKNGHECSGLQD
jgi:hypothetical protein